MHAFRFLPQAALCLAALLPTCAAATQQLPRHNVVAATPDLGALCRAIGGEHVTVTTFVVGPQDPHYLDARPSMLYALQKAELLVFLGRELEGGWLPVLINNGRNPVTQAGQLGHLDCSSAVRALGVPQSGTNRSAGDIHAAGNPHYLLDPLCGLQVAELLRNRMAALWPAERDAFTANFAAFRQRLATAMVGPELAKAYEYAAESLAQAYGNGTLLDVLKEQGDLQRLGGWFAQVAPLRDRALVVDHDLWPYFAERFGFRLFGYLEPKPGMTPSSAHLEQLAKRMRDGQVHVLLASSYFPLQYAQALQKLVPVTVAEVAHQPGARPGTDDYHAFLDYNVRTVVAAFAAADRPAAGR
ncbi:MAG: zinc ABC transporter substrate-binding protein [Planctomycetes bacterium]|nr:zinc ABC transporter substrate-binding protein [Planctomycetota bacterium]